MSEQEFLRPVTGPGSGQEISAPERAVGTPASLDSGTDGLGISPRRLILSATFWAVLAALLSFGAGEAKLLDAAAKRERFVAAGRSIEWSTPATKEAAAQVTSSRLQALFGGLFGLFLGSLGGWARRSLPAAFVAGLVGAGAGAAAGAAASYFVLPAYARYRQMHDGDLAASLLMHVALWAGIGAAGGLALGLGLGGRLRTCQSALGGLVGAIGGALLFDVLGAFIFPLEETGLPTSSSARTRLLARLLVAILAAAGAAWAACQTRASQETTKRTLPDELDTR
jgi:hypothetical protein